MIYHTHCYSREAYELCKTLSIFWRDLRIMKSAALMDLDVERLSDNEVVFELHELVLGRPQNAEDTLDQNGFIELMRAAVTGQQSLGRSYRQTKVNRSLMDSSFLPKVEELLDVMLGKCAQSKLIGVKLDPFKAEVVQTLERSINSMLEERRSGMSNLWRSNSSLSSSEYASLREKISKLDLKIGLARNAVAKLRGGSLPSPKELMKYDSL